MNLGKNIASHRKQKKLKSMDLARLAGVKQPYISAIENGRKLPSIEVLQRIATVLETTTSELLGETPQSLSPDMIRLVDYAKNLKSEQVEALINVVKEFNSRYSKE